MSWTVNRCFVTLAILFLWRVDQMTEACSCAFVHPQQAFCNSDVVIRAKVVAQEMVDSGNDVYGNLIQWIKYDIKQIKMFKGSNDLIDSIYTASSSSLCGVNLESNGNKEYLISGRVETDGKVHVTLCDFIKPWDELSFTQRKNLVERYQSGCDCRITHCTSIPCQINSPTECLWTDWAIMKLSNGVQAKYYSCLKRHDDSCAWYKGSAPPKKEFLDIADP